MDKSLNLKQILTSARVSTISYVIPLLLITCLASFGYLSVHRIIETQQVTVDLQNVQLLILGIILLSILMNVSFIVQTSRINNEQQQITRQQSNHDYLTNLLNRRSFNLVAQQCVAISKRYNASLSVVSFDIDHFKSINQEYGQALGDKVIQDVANTIQQNCRDSDSIFRFDGETFLLLLPQTSETQALKLANKIRNKIANAPTFSEKLIIEITVSGGIAQWQEHETDIEKTLNRAEKALEQAKAQGRDLVLTG